MTTPPAAINSGFLTKQELADILRVTTRTITNYVHNGALPEPLRVGRKTLWCRSALQALLAPAMPSRIDQA
jgi:excisionase family DNA binding protein